jgi:hypothetical protein
LNTLSRYLHDIVITNPTEIDKLKSNIDRSRLQVIIEKEEDEIKAYIKKEKIRYHFEKKYYNFRLVFERETELENSRRLIKKFIAHVLLSHELIVNVINQIEIELGKHERRLESSNTVIDPVKIRSLQGYLGLVNEEYDRYMTSYNIIKSESSISRENLPAWRIEIPTPDPLFCFIDDLFYFNTNGILASSLIRTYFEIKFYPWLENILSNEFRKRKTTKQKLIRFTKNFGLNDFKYWINYLALLDESHLDVLERFYRYGSAAVHSGTFFDRIIAHKTLYFLQELTLMNCDVFPENFRKEVKRSILSEKFKLINDTPFERYNYFQSPSNRRMRKNRKRKSI